MIKNAKIIITGGAGFIGCNLVRTLSPANNVVIIDDFSSGKLDNLSDVKKDITIVKGSVTDSALVKKTLKDSDYVFHLAARPSIDESITNPILTNEVNVIGTLNVLIAAKEEKVLKVIYASSSSVYGDDPKLPKSEDMTMKPISPYAVSKVAAECYCRAFTNVYGLYTTSLRFFNVYGPYQNPHSMYAAAVPKFITASLQKKQIIIFGDGKQTRDFIYVDDVVKCMTLSAECDKAKGLVFNIANGSRISINKLADIVISKTGVKVPIVHTKAKEGDIRHSVADISRVKKILEYKRGYSLKDGLENTIKYLKIQG